jgi:hypothetical protein
VHFELDFTFLLKTKYSDPIDFQVVIQPSQHNADSPVGLNWQHIPAVMNNFIFHTSADKVHPITSRTLDEVMQTLLVLRAKRYR